MAEKESIKVEGVELEREIQKLSQHVQQDTATLRKKHEDTIRQGLLEEKIMNYLLANAKLKDKA